MRAAHWQKRLIKPDGGLVLDNWLVATERSDNHVDPYTLWTLQTGFRQFRGDPQVAADTLDFLVELDQPAPAPKDSWQLLEKVPGAVVPGIYRSVIPGSATRATHVTIRLPLRWDQLQATANAVAQLVFVPDIHRSQIGFPRPAFDAGAIDSDDSDAGLAWEGLPPKVLLGVLEDACPFGHAALIQPAGTATQVIALWDQSALPGGVDGAPPAGLGYGRQRLQPALNRLLAAHQDPLGLDEATLYEDPAALQPRLRERSSHAAAVITLMAGLRQRQPTHSRCTDPPAEEPAVPRRTAARAADLSIQQAPLAVVQFPREQVDLAGGRWMVVRTLDGLRYLANLSARLAPRGQSPVPLVVNLSYGSVVGAHDGTALLETAMAELVDHHPQLAIVLAAGNSYGTVRDADAADPRRRQPSGRHAVRDRLAPGDSTLLALYVPPNKAIESYLEIWFEDPSLGSAEAQFLAAGEVGIEVTSPTGDRLRIQDVPGIDFDASVPEAVTAGLLAFRRVAQSRLRSMALLVVAATQISSTRVEAASGAWQVEVRNRGHRPLRVQAWVERDLVPGGSRSAQAARLLPLDDERAATLTDDNTLNNVATGPGVFRVGALVAEGGIPRPAVSPYSSAAASGQSGPEFSAIADESPAQPGIRVCGNTSGTVNRMNGTSVAAPQVARRIAERLAAGDTLANIREALSKVEGSARQGRLKV